MLTRFIDGSICVEDFGRGIPVDFNKNEDAYNWELLFCDMYAGGKYDNIDGDNYQFSLGKNGLGLCATQYASEYMDAEIYRDGQKYTLHFEKGENVGGLNKEPTTRRQTGSKITWRPDLEVFTDTNIPLEYYTDMLKRQAIVNPSVLFVLKNQTKSGFETQEFKYENGIADYVAEIAGEKTLSGIQLWTAERKGRDREDMPEYKVKMNFALCFSNTVNKLEYYHNSSFL